LPRFYGFVDKLSYGYPQFNRVFLNASHFWLSQSCQPLRFWRNDYAFGALITPLRLSVSNYAFWADCCWSRPRRPQLQSWLPINCPWLEWQPV